MKIFKFYRILVLARPEMKSGFNHLLLVLAW